MNIENDTPAARRAYWTEQMEAAYGFMSRMRDYPVAECGESLASLPEVVAAESLTVVFGQTRIAGRHERLFYLRKGLIRDFVGAAKQLNANGWTLKVEDGFRSRTMQRDIALYPNVLDIVLKKVIWEGQGQIPTPELLLRRLSSLSATCPKVGTHMSGSAIDISVLRSADLTDVDRGGPYLELSELTPMTSPFVSAAAARNRSAISEILRRHGFLAYPYEFWHYSSGDAYTESLTNSGKPARYGAVDFDLATGKTTPILNPTESLHPLPEFQRQLAAALSRCKLSPTQGGVR